MNKSELCSFERIFSEGQLTRNLLGLSPKDFRVKQTDRPEQQLKLITEKAFEHFNEGRLFFFDANLGNNQCHLSALLTAKLFNKYAKIGGISIENAKTADARLLILSFLTANAFNHFLEPLIQSLGLEKSSKRLCNRVKSFVSCTKRDAKTELIDIIRKKTFAMINRFSNKSLRTELLSLAEKLKKKDGKFEFPKFASVLLFLDEARRKRIPLVFRVKMICREGYHIRTFPQGRIEGAAVVFEGMGSTIDLFFSQYRIIRDACHRSFFFNRQRNPQHSCGACMPCLRDAPLAKQKTSFDDMLLSSAADFTSSLQEFQVGGALGILYKTALKQSADLGTSGQCQRPALIIEHAFSETADHALAQKRLLDVPPSVLIERRLVHEKG